MSEQIKGPLFWNNKGTEGLNEVNKESLKRASVVDKIFREYNRVYPTEKYVRLVGKGGCATISAERCQTAAQVLEVIHELSSERWFMREHLIGLIEFYHDQWIAAFRAAYIEGLQ